MIEGLLSIIKTQLHNKNKYLNVLHVNCIKLANDMVVADYNRNEVYEGASDIVGMGGYIRYDGKYEYTKVSNKNAANKMSSSCSNAHGVSVPLKLVIYNFEGGKEFNQARLEEKIQNDLQVVDFSLHDGHETQLSLELVDSDTNSHAVFKAEFGDSLDKGDSFYQMLSVNFKLNFVRQGMKPECFENCDVFNNDEKC